MKIYRATIIKRLQEFYGEILMPTVDQTIPDYLFELANRMLEGLHQQEVCVYTQINNYHANYLGVPIENLKEINFQLSDCLHTTANEYGFKTWQKVMELGNQICDINFENCVQHIIQGNITSLRSAIEKDQSLVQRHSQYEHQATLLHYTASNGVEMWRQQVPQNLNEIIKLLLEKGADKNARMNVYGGQFTTLQLLTTSAHPKDAGMLKNLVEVLTP